MKLVNMALSADEAKERMHECCSDDSAADKLPKYPHGVSLYLDNVTMRKLGFDELPKMGERMALEAIVEVTSVSEYQNQSMAEKTVSLQITDMALHRRSDAAEKLYGGQE